MEWFAVLPDGEASSAAAGALRPLASRMIEHASGRPWIVGDWPDEAVGTVSAGGARLVVVGEWSAATSVLRRRLAEVESVEQAGALGEQVPGCFHLVASVGGQVRVQGTLAAVRRVFSARVAGVHVACDRADVLARLTGASWDPEWLALRLTGLAMPFPFHETSPWRGVRAVPSDCWLRLGSEGRAEEKRRWHAPEPELPLAEGALRVREALTAAVAVRTTGGGTVSTDLSGGMDSTSLAFLAARGSADVVTYRMAEADAGNDDADFAELAASRLPRCRHLVVPADESPGVFGGLGPAEARNGAYGEEPFGWVLNQARLEYEVRNLARTGTRVHLGGHGGDEVFRPGGHAHLHDLVRRRPGAGLRAVRDHRIMSGCSWPAVWRALGDRRSPARELAVRAAELTSAPARRGFDVGWSWPLEMPPWASPEAVQAARTLLRRSAAEAPEPLAPWREQHSVLVMARCSGGVLGQAGRLSARTAGVRLAAPFLDDQVLEAALAVRPEERNHPGRYKPLLAEAMDGILPRRIARRTTKGEFSADFHHGLCRYRADLLDLFADSRLARHGLVDAEALRQTLLTPHPDVAASAPLDGTLACEMWLHAVEAAAPDGEPDEPAESRRPRKSKDKQGRTRRTNKKDEQEGGEGSEF
ncbi:asparagine synthase-related protein [Streptomyces iconiensis]|uniref:asparagine synthase (glutamine-hydrolyzing) n=1 Tax=Streptomyces iconiensis TaxID=1384038 RepID=A0ABT6ZQV2_9ACTN|nr:asparagine synthase-related protein [Streptomyces iconiensis]MDJ1131434.1 asparagine synthase-related protein [Streptomyces iconiensis]